MELAQRADERLSGARGAARHFWDQTGRGLSLPSGVLSRDGSSVGRSVEAVLAIAMVVDSDVRANFSSGGAMCAALLSGVGEVGRLANRGPGG
jgi:hypothetical protein